MSVFRDPAPEPATRLGRHRILSPTAAIRVSPLCLGAMNFGEAWKDFMGECTKDTAFEILDHFYASGGNFIDSANCYQNEESERWLGEWMAARGLRDQIVLATKYTTNLKAGQRASAHDQHSNFTGNSTKSLRLSLDASLRKLQTSYVDVLYVHWWSGDTSIEELMQSLNDVVRAGKALYLGVSDTPAWIVSKANQYARDHGLRQFCVYQGHWSAAARDLEKEILPMCQAEGMAVAPWGALGGGHFLSDEARRAKERDKSGRQMGAATDKAIKVSKVLEEIANAKGTLITSVALAYVVHTSPDVSSVVSLALYVANL